MRLTLRDAYATGFVAVGVLAALSVTAAWQWPLINGVRMGVIALGIAGAFACSVSGWGEQVASREVRWTNPFIILASVLGVLVTIVGVVGLITDEPAYLTGMIATAVALWLVTLTHRLVAGTSGRPVATA